MKRPIDDEQALRVLTRKARELAHIVLTHRRNKVLQADAALLARDITDLLNRVALEGPQRETSPPVPARYIMAAELARKGKAAR